MGTNTDDEWLKPVSTVEQGMQLEAPAGVYTILGELGRGMSTVYLAVEKGSLNRRVALKRMRRPDDDAHSEARRRFYLEAVVPAHIQHPNIIEIYAIGEHDGLPFFVMEYIAGAQTLAQLLDSSDTPLPIERIENLLCHALLGLRAIHAAPGRWHRDIKPDNLLVFPIAGGDESLKYIDFGVMHDPDNPMTDIGVRPGTVGFKAPELFVLRSADCRPSAGDTRSDLYALGVTFFLATCRQHPYPLAAEGDIQAMDLFNRPDLAVPSPASLRPDIPQKLERVLMKLLAPDPSARYQNPSDVLADLAPTSSAGAHPAPVCTSPPTPAARRPAGRRAMLAAFAAGGIVAGSTALLLQENTQTKPHPSESAPPAADVMAAAQQKPSPSPTAAPLAQREVKPPSPAPAPAPLQSAPSGGSSAPPKRPPQRQHNDSARTKPKATPPSTSEQRRRNLDLRWFAAPQVATQKKDGG